MMQLPRLSQEEPRNLNSHLYDRETEILIKIFPT